MGRSCFLTGPFVFLAVHFAELLLKPPKPGVETLKPMSITFTRREYLWTLGAVAMAARFTPLIAAPSSEGKTLRGPFIILNTPFTAAGDIDWDDLVREVQFVDHAGCTGIVWPQGSSSVNQLTKDERMHGMEVLAK